MYSGQREGQTLNDSSVRAPCYSGYWAADGTFQHLYLDSDMKHTAEAVCSSDPSGMENVISMA